MESGKKLRLVILLLPVGIAWLAWDARNFALLLLASAVLLLAVSYFFPRIRTAGIPVAVGLLCLSVAELALPLIIPTPSNELVVRDRESGYLNGYYEQIEGFGYRPVPGVHTSREFTPQGEVIYDVTYTIGDDGYRRSGSDKPFAAYLYGGSFTFGEGLNDDETLVHYLWTDHAFNTKSVGIHGYGLQHALYAVEHGITASNGFNILLTVPWHALRSSCKPEYTPGTPKYVLAGEYAQLAGVCSGGGLAARILRQSNVFKLVQKALFNEINRITDEDIELYLAIVRTIARHTRQSNSRLVIAYIQATEDRMQFTRWSNDSLLAEFRGIADIVVDVTLSEKQETLERRYYIHELDQHPSAEANRERARLIFEALSSVR